MVNAESLEVTRDGSTKEGIRYIGLRQPSGKRFRVYFNFGEPSECTFDSKCEAESRCKMAEGQLVGRPIWIYALHARCAFEEKKACYIGQTVDLTRRLREHYLHRRPERSSFAFFEWAKENKEEVMVTLLERTDKGQSYATRCEGHWIHLARTAGYELPNVEKWGALPTWKHVQFKSHNESRARTWSETLVRELSSPISELGLGDRVVTPRLFRLRDSASLHWII
ncbi:GIY-YIG nuclease family protein [Paraburkholderia sp. SEWSISQ10-3 4]|nr:GIY-YIG nuclease family protein [Paraburkholderia aspalathi]MDN7169890.1 GIY-YIG nuclease family protein [Paraburkholderia sp. SEWSISQ10-3 4]MDQ6499529.1 GIY-YIG nuclease family protein [Paraburkholderia aspalathi]